MNLFRFFCGGAMVAAVCLTGCSDSSSDAPARGGITVANFQAAATVIGQATFTSFSSGRAVAPHTMEGSYGSPVVANGILYVSDYHTNRVLGFNTIPASNGANANFVLGQPDLTTSNAGILAGQLSGPESIRYANGKLFVLDYNNNRIMIWNTQPTSSGIPADVVVGQAGFGTGAVGSGTSGFTNPDDFCVAGGKLFVADSGNHRILIWNTIPTTNGVPADVVLGQSDFIHTRPNDDNQDGVSDATPSNRTLLSPSGIWSDGIRLIVCDSNNNRVLIWNTVPTMNFAPANIVLGQNDFTHNMLNDDNQDRISDSAPSARTLSFPYYLDSNGTQLVVTDSSNNRVLLWDSFPTSNFAPASYVLGQGDFIHDVGNDNNQDNVGDATPTARTLRSPRGVYIYNDRIFVGDYGNDRILIY